MLQDIFYIEHYQREDYLIPSGAIYWCWTRRGDLLYVCPSIFHPSHHFFAGKRDQEPKRGNLIFAREGGRRKRRSIHWRRGRRRMTIPEGNSFTVATRERWSEQSRGACIVGRGEWGDCHAKFASGDRFKVPLQFPGRTLSSLCLPHRTRAHISPHPNPTLGLDSGLS